MPEEVEFIYRQPGYIRAVISPSTLRGYEPKKMFPCPLWLDYWLFGPPIIRDSSPGGMAMIFGRTEYDTEWNKTKKGPLVRGFNFLVLLAAYVFFLYIPYHEIYFRGIRPYFDQTPEAAEITCKSGFMRACEAGCERSGPFNCVPLKS
jgi:hypothetical protein